MKTLSKTLVLITLLNAFPLMADDTSTTSLTYTFDSCGCLIMRSPTENESSRQQREVDAQVFPMRTNGTVNIISDLAKSEQPTHFTISTLDGEVISHGELRQNHTVTEITGPAGIYLVTVKQSDSFRTFKIIKN